MEETVEVQQEHMSRLEALVTTLQAIEQEENGSEYLTSEEAWGTGD